MAVQYNQETDSFKWFGIIDAFREKVANVSVEVDGLFKNTINKMGKDEISNLFKTGGMDDFIKKHKIIDSDFIKWAKTVDKTTFSLKNYQDYLIKSGKHTTSFANITKKATTVAKSFGAALGSMAINAVIGIIISGIEKLIVTQEELKEKADEALSVYEEAQNKLKSDKQTIDEIASDYERLASGVDQFGNNISLNTEEYNRYNEIVNKVAEMFPQMVQGYTDEGNAILAHKGNVEELTKAYEEQKQAANDALIISGSDVFKSFRQTYTNEGFRWSNLLPPGMQVNESLRDQKKFLQEILDNDGISYEQGVNLNKSEINALKLAGIEQSVIDSLVTGVYGATELVDLNKIEARVRQLTTQINAEAAKVKPVLNAYIESDPDYNKLDEKTKEVADRIINGLGADYISEAGSDIGAYAKIVEDVIKPLQDAGLSNEFNTIFDLQTKFNNGEITVDEYQNKLNAFLPLLDKLDPEIKKSVLLLFGIEINEDGTVVSDEDAMKNNVKEKLEGEFHDNIGTLTIDELKIASDLVIPDNTRLSWDELIAKIKEVKELTKEEDPGILLTDLKSSADALSVLQTALNEMNDDGSISIDTLSTIQEKFANVDGIDKYINKLSEVKKGSKEFQDILTDLTYSYLENQYTTEELANVDESLLATMLRSAGVANANEIAQYAIARAKAELSYKTKISEAATLDDALALKEEALQAGVTEQAFYDLILEMKIFNNQDLNITSKMQALIELETQAGITASAIRNALNGASTTGSELSDASSFVVEMGGFVKNGEIWYNGVNYGKGENALKNATQAALAQYKLDTWDKMWEEKRESESRNPPDPNYTYGSSQKDAENQLKQQREKEAQLEEAWEKERLERLKDDLSKRENELEKYKSRIETLDFGLDILDESNYSGQIDLLTQKYGSLSEYGSQLRQEFDRVSQIVPNTADEAQEIASRVQELGSEMRNNLKTMRETVVEIQRTRIELLRIGTVDVLDNLLKTTQDVMDEKDMMDNPFYRARRKDIDNNISNTENIFDKAISELEKQLEEQEEHDKALIAEVQKTQDTINDIVTKALEMQIEENAKTRAEERAKLEEELAEISSEYKSTLDEASKNTTDTQKKISGEFDNVSNSAQTMQQNVDTHFGNMETNVATHVDNTIKKIDELENKISKFNQLSYNPSSNLLDKINPQNASDYSAIGGAVAPSYTRVSSPYGMRKHPISGTNKFHDGIDLAAPGGSPVLAYSQGVVTYAGWNGGYGNYVEIDHGNGYTTFYAHLSKINVSNGQSVAKGTWIGNVGSTGKDSKGNPTSTGNHLHFGAKYNGSSYDPNNLFKPYAKGTKDYGIAGENNKREYAINKKTGEWSAIDSPTLFDKSKYDIVGEKVSEKIDKPIPTYSSGTIFSKDSVSNKDIKTELPKLTVEQITGIISKHFPNSVLSVNDAQKIYEAQQTTGMSAAVILAIGALESGWGKSNIAKTKNNLWGWNATNDNPSGNATAWDSVGEAAMGFAQKYMGTYYDERNSKSIYSTGTGNNESGLGYAYNDDGSINKKWADDVGNITAKLLNTATEVSNDFASNTEALENNTNALEEKEDTNPYSTNNFAETSKKYIEENITPLELEYSEWINNRENQINTARNNNELSEVQWEQEWFDLLKQSGSRIETLIDGVNEYYEEFLQDAVANGASTEIIEEIENLRDETIDKYKQLSSDNVEELEETANTISSLLVDNLEKWTDATIEGFNREINRLEEIVNTYDTMQNATNDPIAQSILNNRAYDALLHEREYLDDNITAKTEQRDIADKNLLAYASLYNLLGTREDGSQVNPYEDWFNIDGTTTDLFEKDIKDIAFRYGEFAETNIRGAIEASSQYRQSIYEDEQKILSVNAELFSRDQQKIDTFINSSQKAIQVYTDAIEVQKESLNDQITYYNLLNTLLSKYYSIVNSVTEEHHNINKELKASQTMYQYLDAHTRRLLFNEEDYVKLSEELNGIQSRANKLRSQYEYDLAHAASEEIEEMTNYYERQYEMLMKSYEITKARLEVEKKQTELNNVLNERNVRMFINGQWQWVANTQDVISAQNELEDAKFSLTNAETQKSQTQSLNNLSGKSDNLSTQINFLDAQITEINDRWDKITEIAEGGVLSVSQAWSDIVKTDSKYLNNFVSEITSAFNPFYKMLTGNDLTALEEYQSFERSIEPSSGFHEDGYVNFSENYGYGSRDSFVYGNEKEDSYTLLSNDEYLKLLGYKPLTSIDLSELASQNLNIQDLLPSIEIPTNNIATTNNITNNDNRVIMNGVEITGEDGEVISETVTRYTHNH